MDRAWLLAGAALALGGAAGTYFWWLFRSRVGAALAGLAMAGGVAWFW